MKRMGEFFLWLNFFLISPLVLSAPVFNMNELPASSEIIENYKKKLSAMKSEVCEIKDNDKYIQLLKNFRQEGYTLPFLAGDKLDSDAISNNLSKIQTKIEWIRQTAQTLEKKPFPVFKNLAAPIEARVARLLELKKQHRFSKNKKIKGQLLAQSNEELKFLKKETKAFFNQIEFLLNAHFPMSHQENREKYEETKMSGSHESQKKANEIFFQRKIYEDGTFDKNQLSSDIFLRTTLDTLALNVEKEKDFLSENTRFDFDWVLKNLKIVFKKGKTEQVVRLKKWADRTEEALVFYQKLLILKKPSQQKIVKARVEATAEIREFVLNKLKNVYSYWLEQDEVYQALFVSDMVLMNEVGRPMGYNLDDRKDILQVVLNRKESQKYSKIEDGDALFPFISKIIQKKKNTQNSDWLDVLFKEGEFSFTYYFIPSVVTLFCPETSVYAHKMRQPNLELAISHFKAPDWNFKAFRYFSRISMIGKVDMSTVWKGQYEPMKERPGVELKITPKIKSILQKRNFDYRYSFQAPDGKNYDVIHFLGKTYSVYKIESTPVLYQYRDPQHFTYFSAHSLTASN